MKTRETTPSPGKEQVRRWLRQRSLAPGPLPDPEVIRRELGWGTEARHTSTEAKYGYSRSKS
ncbi:MAG: hypothetical protein EOO81_08875 [Oxalobacteraceae bacterium]|nr:MAG: hypothetical protein EOO81_08875 [Oxalobacteraceae bacterium]